MLHYISLLLNYFIMISDVVLETKVLVSRRLEDRNKVLVLVLVLVLTKKS